jgi:hypothetical protein
MSSAKPNGSAEPAGGLVVLHVRDEINHALAGHDAIDYESPPQPREQALVLARVLLGYTGDELDGTFRWGCPVAGGRRTVTLRPAAGSDQ